MMGMRSTIRTRFTAHYLLAALVPLVFIAIVAYNANKPAITHPNRQLL